MKFIALLAPMWLAVLALGAELAWPEPVAVVEAPNIEFTGGCATAANGNTLVSWSEIVGGANQLCLNLFDEEGQALWAQPLSHEIEDVPASKVVATQEGDFIYTYQADTGIRACRVSPDGTQQWDAHVFVGGNFLHTGNGFTMLADDYGGVWFLCYVSNLASYVLQHLNPNGIALLPVSGMLIDPEYNISAAILSLPLGEILVAYRSSNELRVKRLDALGSILWPEPVSIPVGGEVHPRLSMFTSERFALSWWDALGLRLQRYGFDGTPLWPQPLLVFAGTAGSDAANTVLTPSSDSCVFVSAEVWSQPALLQKVSPAGELLFGSGVEMLESSMYFAPDDAGGCYIGNDIGDIRLCHVNATGEQTWGVSGLPVCVEGSHQVKLSLRYANNAVTLVWMDWRPFQSGIYCQRVTPGGTQLLGENGLPLHIGVYADILSPEVRAVGDKTAVVWLQRGNTYGRYAVMLQIVLPDGSVQFRPGGMPLSPACVSQTSPIAPNFIVTPAGDLFVGWFDSAAAQYNAQLYSEQGNPLWAPQPVPVSGVSPGARTTYLDGSFIFIWLESINSGSSRIWGQKLTNGVVDWPAEGIQLVADHPDYPNSSPQGCKIAGNYIAWQQGQVYVLGIDSDGTPSAGFDPWGKLISQCEPPYYMGTFDILSQGENLHCSWYEFQDYSVEYSEVITMQQIVTPNGETLVPGAGVANGTLNYLHDVGVGPDCFFAGIGSNGYYNLKQRSLDGTLLSEHTYHLGAPQVQTVYLGGLENGNVLQFAKLRSSNQYRYKFFYVNPQGQLVSPADNLVFECSLTAGTTVSYSRSGDDFVAAASFRNNSPWICNNLLLQRISPAGSYAPAEESTPQARLTLGANYPNPFAASTTLSLTTDRSLPLEIAVYNLRGQKVRSLCCGIIDPGITEYVWDGLDERKLQVSDGVYLVLVSGGNQKLQRKILKLR